MMDSKKMLTDDHVRLPTKSMFAPPESILFTSPRVATDSSRVDIRFETDPDRGEPELLRRPFAGMGAPTMFFPDFFNRSLTFLFTQRLMSYILGAGNIHHE